METVRAFIGCVLDLGATRKVQELSRATRALATSAGWEARWVPSPNLHFTLRFLGDLDQGLVEPVADAMRAAARATPTLLVGVGGLGAFPDRESPKVLFADVTRGHDALAALAGRIEAALAALGFPRADRPFVPHMTLGRVQSSRGGLAAVTPANCDCGVGTISALTLYRSDLFSKGAEHIALARAPLGSDG
jgi:RNA 2',3'-cyclic 3'-phosphodiesterase